MDTPSSSTSSDDSPTSLENCQICLQPAHGKHFGVYSCRACSAFFRRIVIGNFEETLKCRNLDGKCEAKRGERFNCKKCRLQRCYDAGMSADKFQLDRDLVSSTQQFIRKRKMISNIPHSPENFLGRPSFIFSCEPDLACSKKTFIDLQFLIDQAASFFDSNTDPKKNEMLTRMNTLERLSYALDLSRVPSREKPIICTRIGKKEKFIYWEHKFMATATWLTYCDEFQQLDQSTKIEFLKSIWFVWTRVENLGKKTEKGMKNGKLDKMCHIMRNIYIDANRVEIDTSWMSNYSREQLQYFNKKPSKDYLDHIISPLIDLRASPEEITYLICVISFHYAAKTKRGEIAELSEKLIDILANDLHNYYFNELKLKNYASRMAQLMKIVQFVENDIYERTQRIEIARVFDVYTVEFSHPEMFIEI